MLRSSSKLALSSIAARRLLLQATPARVAATVLTSTATKQSVRQFSLPSWLTNNSSHSAADSSASALHIKEKLANASLSNPGLQADFYRTLLAANYPHIVISRFETTGVARNRETEALYVAALKAVGDFNKAQAVESQMLSQNGE